MSTPDGERFDASSPVGRYWLMHGVGFTVRRADGHAIGVVDEVHYDSVRQRAQRVMVRRRRLGGLRRRRTLLPSLVETVVPESKLFIVGTAAGEVRMPGRRRARAHEFAARAAAALARAVAAARPLASWSRRHGAAALAFAGRSARRGARGAASASAAAAARTRRDAPRLGAWLEARARTSGRVTASALRALGGATRVASSRLAAATRVAARDVAVGARVTARVLGELAVLAAVLVSDAWKRAAAHTTASRTPLPEAPQQPVEPEAEPQSDLDAPLAREATAKRPRSETARAANRKRGT